MLHPNKVTELAPTTSNLLYADPGCCLLCPPEGHDAPGPQGEQLTTDMCLKVVWYTCLLLRPLQPSNIFFSIYDYVGIKIGDFGLVTDVFDNFPTSSRLTSRDCRLG